MSKVPPHATHFIINADKMDCEIFAAWQKKNGDISIRTKTGPKYRTPGINNPNAPKYKNVHMSIHRSDISEDGNLIKGTMTLYDGTKVIESPHFTKAIKSTGQFSYVMSRRCPLLATPTFAFTKKDRTLCSLRSYDPRHFSLIYGIFVGPPGKSFDIQSSKFNVTHHSIDFTDIIVVWTYLNIPSLNLGFTRHISTFNTNRPESLPKGMTIDQAHKLITGYPAEKCLSAFELDCEDMKNEYLISLRSLLGETNYSLRRKHARLFNSGWSSSPEFMAYRDGLLRQGIYMPP